jgi:hypothetical protein
MLSSFFKRPTESLMPLTYLEVDETSSLHSNCSTTWLCAIRSKDSWRNALFVLKPLWNISDQTTLSWKIRVWLWGYLSSKQRPNSGFSSVPYSLNSTDTKTPWNRPKKESRLLISSSETKLRFAGSILHESTVLTSKMLVLTRLLEVTLFQKILNRSHNAWNKKPKCDTTTSLLTLLTMTMIWRCRSSIQCLR